MEYRNVMFLEKIPLSGAQFSWVCRKDAPSASQAGHQSGNKDIATLKEPCINTEWNTAVL